MKNKKISSGFTLLEAVIALAVWAILSASVIFMWQHVSNRSASLMAKQSALENARVAMDALIANIQRAWCITLNVGREYDLMQLSLQSFDTNNRPHRYNIVFNSRLTPSAETFQRLNFGGAGNELASNIAMIRMWPVGELGRERHIHIIITTGCEIPIILEGSVDIRYKNFTFNRPS